MTQVASDTRCCLLCKREEGAEYSQAQCVSGECGSCGGLQRVLHIFCDIKEQVFGASDFDLSELKGRRHDLRDEEPVELEEREKEGLGEGMTEYNRHMRTFHLRKTWDIEQGEGVCEGSGFAA